MATFCNKLDPHYSARTAYGVKGNRQGIVVTNSPSTIDANQILTIRFPNLGENDVIIPGTVRLAFNITMNGDTDANHTIVINLGQALMILLYNRIVDILMFSADTAVPKCKKNFFKFWWDSDMDELKEKSIASCKLWKDAGKPRSGSILTIQKR